MSTLIRGRDASTFAPPVGRRSAFLLERPKNVTKLTGAAFSWKYLSSLIAVDKREPRRPTRKERWIITNLAEDSGIAKVLCELPAVDPAEREIWLHFAGLFPKPFTSGAELEWEDFERDNIRATRNIARLVSSRNPSARLFFPSTALLLCEGVIDDIKMRQYADSKLVCERLLTRIAPTQTAYWRLVRIIGVDRQRECSTPALFPDDSLLHQVLLQGRSTGDLPDDVISSFLIKATENPIRPLIRVTNCDFVRTYMHISDLLGSLLNLIDSDSFGLAGSTPPVPSAITLETIGRVVQEGLRKSGLLVELRATPAGVKSVVSPSPNTNGQVCVNAKDSAETVRRAMCEYLELASQFVAGTYS